MLMMNVLKRQLFVLMDIVRSANLDIKIKKYNINR